MTTIDGLSVQGIRSFDNHVKEIIKFNGPLTLIVGCNGSGKTTIIECLKYAASGIQPPNSQGGAFVHDPKLAGEKEVLAQVKMSFSNGGSRFVVTRSLQLTVASSGKRSLKTLDGSLVINRNGERTTMSHNVASLERLVPEQLGVSKAVIDNVIFCHQEESMWPMSASSELKKKFDEIFDALKYTKAVDNLKVMKKNHGVKLKELKILEEVSKKEKDRGEKSVKQQTELSRQIEDIRVEVAQIMAKMEAASKQANDKHKEASRALDTVSLLNSNRSNATFLQDQLRDMAKTLVERPESTEELKTTLERYEEQVAQYEAENQSCQLEYKAQQDRSAEVRRKLAEKQAQKGQFQAQKENYENRLQSRLQLVRQSASKFGIRGYDGDLEEDAVGKFVTKLRKQSQNKDRELVQIRADNEAELERTRRSVTDVESRRSQQTQAKITARQAVDDNEKRVKLIQQKVNDVEMNEGILQSLETTLKDAQAQLQTANSDYEKSAWDTQIKTMKGRLAELDSILQGLTSELMQCNKMASDSAKLALHKDSLVKAKGSSEMMISTHGEQLNTIIGRGWKVETLDHEYSVVKQQRSQAVADAKKDQDNTSRKLADIESKLKTLREQMKKKEADMKAHQIAVLDSITLETGETLASVDEYEPELQALEEYRKELQKQIDGFGTVTEFYADCLKVVNGKNKCRLCDRSFSDEKERSSAIDRIKKKMTHQALQSLEEDLRNANVSLQKANAARSHYTRFGILAAEIPELKKDTEECDKTRGQLLRVIEQKDRIVDQEEIKMKDAEMQAKTVSTIVGYFKEISRLEAEIASMSQLNLSGKGLTAEEISQKSMSTTEEKTSLSAKFEKISSGRERANAERRNLEMEISKATSDLQHGQNELEKKRGLLVQLQDYRENNTKQSGVIEQADLALQGIATQLDIAKEQHKTVEDRARAKEDSIRTEKDKLANTVNQFDQVESDIHRYVESGGDDKLNACEQALRELDNTLLEIEGEYSRLTKILNGLTKKLNDRENMKKTILENLNYRTALTKSADLEKTITELEHQAGIEDYDGLKREADRADRHYNALKMEKSSLEGRAVQIDAELVRLLEQFDLEFKDASQKYKKSHIEVETTNAAIQDIGKYVNAIENAIIKFHKRKMSEINRIAGELWQSTYQGTDVDTIMIRSDHSTDANGKSTYNYRVVMVKQNAEMDMRGRCSAGQKVLASIIIRLALAECFGINLGLIALDEPTTNLDRATIKSLAQSLNSLIKVRRSQVNFQLIIITHDEEFLREMKVQEFTDVYYRVGRNGQQKSVIEIQDVGGIMA